MDARSHDRSIVDEAIPVDHETEYRIEPPEALERAAGVGRYLRDIKCEGLAVAKTQLREPAMGPQEIVDESAALQRRVLLVEMHPAQRVGVSEACGARQGLPDGCRAALGPSVAILRDRAIKIDTPPALRVAVPPQS